MLGRLVLLALVALPAAAAPTAVATFAGGCFWCMEPPFDALDGVLETTVGYTGGALPNPSYEAVSSGKTGHVEAVRIVYDPARLDYRRLLEVFWRNIDPTRDDGQFCDHGPSYRAMIFYHDARQKALAEESRAALAASGRFARVVTPIRPAGPFYPAEDRHQDYYRKNPLRYAFYRKTCGRDRFLRKHWGEAAD